MSDPLGIYLALLVGVPICLVLSIALWLVIERLGSRR